KLCVAGVDVPRRGDLLTGREVVDVSVEGARLKAAELETGQTIVQSAGDDVGQESRLVRRENLCLFAGPEVDVQARNDAVDDQIGRGSAVLVRRDQLCARGHRGGIDNGAGQ